MGRWGLLRKGFLLGAGLLASWGLQGFGLSFGLELTQSKKLRVSAFSGDPAAIDMVVPHFHTALKVIHFQLSDPLVFISSDGKLMPGLAERWERISPTRYRFYLRRGVVFHNGEKFDSASVKFSLETMLRPELAGTLEFFVGNRRVILNDLDPYQVDVESTEPYAPFLKSMNTLLMLPPQYIKEKGLAAFHEHPVGTGPFEFGSWTKGKELVLKKNPRYWKQGVPEVEELIFDFSSQEEAVKKLFKGELDMMVKLDGRLTRRALEHPHLKIKKRLATWQNVVVLQDRGALADRNVRRAMNLAINREDIIRYAEMGNAVPLKGFAAQGALGANESLQPYAYHPPEAKRLLKQAGVTGRLKLKGMVLFEAAILAKIVREQLKVVGIDLELEIADLLHFNEKIRVFKKSHPGQFPDYDLVFLNDSNTFGELGYFMRLYFWSGGPWSLINQSAELDRRLLDALAAVDEVQYEKKLKQLDATFYSEALSLFTIQRILTVAARKDLEFEIPLFASFGNTPFFSEIRFLKR